MSFATKYKLAAENQNLRIAKTNYFKTRTKMKFKFSILLVGLLCQGLITTCFAQNKIPFSIAILVKDLETERKLNNIYFEIIDEQTSKITLPSAEITNSPMLISLEPEKIYTATISKAGYVKQILTISTQNLSKSKQLKSKYNIEIIGEIFEQFKDEDYSAFEKSFGIIKFNLQANDFIWNPNKILQRKEEEIKSFRRKARKEGNILVVKEAKKEDHTNKKENVSPAKAILINDTSFVKSIEIKKEMVNNGEVLITSVVFQNGETKEYRRISYEWGGLYFKVNQSDISEVSYNINKTKYGF